MSQSMHSNHFAALIATPSSAELPRRVGTFRVSRPASNSRAGAETYDGNRSSHLGGGSPTAIDKRFEAKGRHTTVPYRPAYHSNSVS